MLAEAENIAVAAQGRWPIVRLGEIAEVKLGKMLDRAKHQTGRRLPYLRNVNVRWGTIETHDLLEMNFEEDQLDRFGLKENDVLVCEGGEPGRASAWNGHLPNLKFQKALHRVRFKKPFEPRLLVYYLELLAKTGALERRFTGSTIKHFTREAFVQLPVPVPSFDEQHRIVAEIEKQFTRLDAGGAALRRVQANLKRYRAAVLKAACEGRLVPTEAELAKAENRKFETGEELLTRILTERRKQWQGRGKYKEPATPDISKLSPLPNGWAWARLEQLGVIYGGLTKNPNRAKLAKQLPYLRVANVYANELRLNDIEYIGVADSELDKLLVHSGDLLIVEGNGSKDQIGRLAIWNGSIDMCVHQNHLIKVRPVEPRMPKWILHWLQSPGGRQFVELVASSTSGLFTLSVNKVGNLLIPVPPLAEQTRLVAEVERRLSVAEELEAALAADLQRAIRIRQGVLRHAFMPSS